MDLDGDYVLLSEMQDAGLIQNCGWFSNLFKKIVKVAVAVVAVAVVCVATAGAGVAACIAIGAAVGAAESVATQLVETGSVNPGTLLLDTALGAIPGGVAGKAIAKNTVKTATASAIKTSASKATQSTVKTAVKTVASNYSNKLNKELIEVLQKESVSADCILARVNQLTSTTNTKLRIINTNGNKVVDKTVFAKQGANGTVRRINNGEEVGDIVQGALVFREKNVSHVIKVSQEISSNASKNMDVFDRVLKDQLKNTRLTDKFLIEMRQYFQKQGKNIDKINEKDIKVYRQQNNKTWHECADKHTVQLVDKTLHNEVSHTGGRFEVKYGGN